MNLTKPQRQALEYADKVARVGHLVGAMTASATARVLTRLGLVTYMGEYECDSDHCDRAGDHPHEGSVYAITDEGKRLVESWRCEETTRCADPFGCDPSFACFSDPSKCCKVPKTGDGS